MELISPLHIGTGEGFSGIIDKRTISHQKNNQRFPIILGHSVKGIIKEEFRKLQSFLACPASYIEEIFGMENRTGSFYFSPCRLDEKIEEILEKYGTDHVFQVKSGNQIVRGRKVAKAERLFTHEVVNDHVKFHGHLQGYTKEPATASSLPEPIILLLFALKGMRKMGGRRRSGLGTCQVNITEVQYGDKKYTGSKVISILNQYIEDLEKGAKSNEAKSI